MKLACRYCQHCRRKALTPKSPGRAGMRPGYVYRAHHDLCGRCFREATARALREWSRRSPDRKGPLPMGRPTPATDPARVAAARTDEAA